MATSATSGLNINSDQFLQLLVAQLKNQDPLSPVSDKDFMQQINSLTQTEQITKLNASFSQMLQLQQLTQGANLLGKTIEYRSTTGKSIQTGTVSQVTVENDEFKINIGSTKIGLDQIISVK